MLSGVGEKLVVGAMYIATVMDKSICEAQSLQQWQDHAGGVPEDMTCTAHPYCVDGAMLYLNTCMYQH